MMEARPIIVDETGLILGGNMRYKVLQHMGYKEVQDSWVKHISDLTEDQKKEFVIKDNISFGEWDFEVLEDGWSDNPLEEWGLDIPITVEAPVKDVEEKELHPYRQAHILLSFRPEDINQIMDVISSIECEYEIEQTAN